MIPCPVTRVKTKLVNTDGGTIAKFWRETSGYQVKEVYVSTLKFDCVRGWKNHKEMMMRVSVVEGQVRFVFTLDGSIFWSDLICNNSFDTLIIPSGTWYAFQGIGPKQNVILSLASCEYRESEILRKPIDAFEFDWKSL